MSGLKTAFYLLVSGFISAFALGARHGVTTFNEEGRIHGTTPGELSAIGKQQARLLGQHVSELGEELVVYASDLQRVVDTARIVQELCPGLKIQFTPELRERHFGDLEGKLKSEVDYDGFWDSAHSQTVEFTWRVARFIVALPEADTDKTVLLLAHDGVLNRLLWLENPEAYGFVEHPHTELVSFDAASILRHSQELLDATG